ncbi:XRE family transcriptional regulator [Staphylococcus caledonicus]|uniref:XRE family transcriptional regulator n=1 Tax=Staphylococcus caledonicus TaxID=2741333 RepID=UPI0018E4ADA0|nr:XRE family transcriptional regulator [Staphylococcus caledonicus]MBI5973412.1 XRE family transcriptional regulator [Staphylococcus caledonicus]
MITKKKKIKKEMLKPKKTLKEERLKREYSLSYMANVIGVDRRQYKLKEEGFYPFHDYEIIAICNEININIDTFFI